MSWLQPKLHLKVAQKQILTPGLVQMVSVLALNRLELREMITAEMVANPMLEELTNDGPGQRRLQKVKKPSSKAETEKSPETEPANPFDEFDIASFFNQYLDRRQRRGPAASTEVIEKPSFRKIYFVASGGLSRAPWLATECGLFATTLVREIAEIIIGNLDEKRLSHRIA